MLTHNWKTILLWTTIFILGGLQAIKGNTTADFTVIISILGMVEHLLEGNTGV